MKLFVALMSLLFLAGTMAYDIAIRFDLSLLKLSEVVKSFRSTQYYVHYVTPIAKGPASPLVSKDGNAFEILVSNRDFCFGALQGTIAIRNGSNWPVYNVDGLVARFLATCSFKGGTSDETNAKLGRQAWVKLTGNGEHGLGARGWRIAPFRTIAVDPKAMPLGTVLFIPKLRGFEIDADGRHRIHDGYVIAGDVGSSITGNHIDFFTGRYFGPPLST